jgi:hypothetical protein
MRRILSSSITAAVIFVMIALPVSSTQAEQLHPGGSVVGGAEFQYAGITRLVQFSLTQAQGEAVRGAMQYSDEYGEWYRVDVRQLQISGHTAFFAGEVTSASRADWVGLWFSGVVVDVGELSAKRDLVSGAFSSEMHARSTVRDQIAPSELFSIQTGNLVVRSL